MLAMNVSWFKLKNLAVVLNISKVNHCLGGYAAAITASQFTVQEATAASASACYAACSAAIWSRTYLRQSISAPFSS